MNRVLVLVLMACGVMISVSAVSAKDGRETYTNPIAGGTIRMGDPFVMLYENTYYLYGTTRNFCCWWSKDFADWEYAGPAYRTQQNPWATGSFWAPEVHRYRGKFYLIYSAKGPDRRVSPTQTQDARPKEHMWICLAASDKPEGPFVDVKTPLFMDDESCIDGHLFLDDGDVPYIYFTRVGATGNPYASPPTGYMYGKTYGARLSPDLTQLQGEPVLCVQADQAWEQPESMFSRCNEGAFVFKRGGRYYMTYSAYHYARPEYGIGCATASSPLGPWTKSPNNPLVTRHLDIGVSGPGHNSITTSPDGMELFMVYHTHADPNKPGADRTVNIDRLIVMPDGDLHLLGPTRSPQPVPSGNRRDR